MTEATNDSGTVKTALVHVLVTRGMDKTATQVPEYEIALLEAAHMAENVERIEGEEIEVDVPNDVVGEYERMRKKYNGKGLRVVERVYPTVGDFAKASGLGAPKNAGANRRSPEASQAVVNTRSAAKKKAAKGKSTK
jgi:hypothetical protein